MGLDALRFARIWEIFPDNHYELDASHVDQHKQLFWKHSFTWDDDTENKSDTWDSLQIHLDIPRCGLSPCFFLFAGPCTLWNFGFNHHFFKFKSSWFPIFNWEIYIEPLPFLLFGKITSLFIFIFTCLFIYFCCKRTQTDKHSAHMHPCP